MGTTQGSFQQSLVEIGSVVSEEKIFFKFHPPFFLLLAWQPSWLEKLCLAFHTSDQDDRYSGT
jgi:UV DNA damage repair endonuclease